MLMILMTISLISAITFVFLKHPLSLGLSLLIQTIAVALTMGFFNLNFWYSYLLFLVMIGGMLVLFIYMTSVASNEKFHFSMKLMIMILTLMSLSFLLLSTMDYYFPNINNLNMESLTINSSYTHSLNKFLNAPLIMVMFMMIIYLLITLIAVVKITDIKSGPLRQSN